MSDAQNQKTIRVLLADDHNVVRAGIRQFLERDPGIRVVAEANNGKEACDLIEKYAPDVAVLDIQMPGMSGIEVTRWIRSRRMTTPQQKSIGVLILTAYEDEPYVKAVLSGGANGYVLKTADPKEIVQAVLDVYEGKSVLDTTLAVRLFHQLADDQSQPVERISERELQILSLAAKGLTNKAIGVQLGISDRTVQNHLANIFAKLQAASRTEAVMRAVSMGLIPPNITETS